MKKFKVGNKVKLTEKTKESLSITDDLIWEIIEILPEDVDYQIVIEVIGKSQPQFVNKGEIILVK